MSRWRKPLKDFVKKKCKGILTISGLYDLVLADIQEVAAMALKDREAFYGRLSRRMEKQYLADTDSLKREYESLAGRNQEIDDTFISLYADKAKGILTEKRFLKLTDAMEREQENN